MNSIQEITVDQAREMAKKWEKEGRSWHFHALFPSCIFNIKNDRHAFVMEDRTSDRTYAVYSDNCKVELSQEFMKLRYGDDIFRTPTQPAESTKMPNKILAQVEVFTQKHILWHHHMLLPDCIYNQHPGKWKIVLEGSGIEENMYKLYDEEPLDVLRLIEIEYFKELDPTFKTAAQGKE